MNTEIISLRQDSAATAARPRRVLIVDSESRQRSRYAELLQGSFVVDTAPDGQSAARLIRERSFDVMVTDLALDDMEGLTLLRLLRAQDADIPVIVMTQTPSTASAVEALEAGAMRYLTKPVQFDELSRALDDGCKRHDVARLKGRALRMVSNMEMPSGDRGALDQSFERALESIYLAYQPVIRWSQRQVQGWEALARCNEPSLPTPQLLFRTAEVLGRKAELNRRLRARIAKDLQELPIEGDVFVNIEASELVDDELFSKTSPLAPFAKRIVLEITERETIERIEHVRARVFALRRLGYRIAVDDLGAGYSALTSFAQLEPEVVKIDMSLIRNVHREPVKRKLITLIISMCRQMGTAVIAEGVETAEELAAMEALHCDLFQGFLFAKPSHPLPPVSWPTIAEKG